LQPHLKKELSRAGGGGPARAQARTRGSKFPFLTITLFFPLILLGALEGTLRLAHYGPDLSLFASEEIGARAYSVMNPDVKDRYFTHVEFSPNTSPDYFTVPKSANTFRIFCLGGSTTVGYPYGYVGSFSTFLRDRLRALFPERHIEVINLGLTATNSFTVNDIARELPAYEPDLLIVYDGHNEFYGALGIASHETAGSARWLTLTYLRLIHIRSFVLLRDGVRAVARLFSPRIVPDRGGTMMERLARDQYIPYGSKAYRECLSNFKDNLRELTAFCADRKIPLLLSTQASNLRDRPPFVTGRRDDLGSGERAAVEELIRGASAQARRATFDSAIASFRKAQAADSLRADLHYEIARCLDTLGRKREARSEYVRARDYDELRFRTSSDFNAAIRSACSGHGAALVDIEQVLAGESPDSLLGNNLILEHLHPNLRGYFLIAREYARSMREQGLLAPKEEWQQRDTMSDARLFRDWPGTDLDERCAERRIEALTESWPFTAPSGSPPPGRRKEPLDRIVEGIAGGNSTWEEGHVAAARLYETSGRIHEAEREYMALINQLPYNVSAYLILGQLYLRRQEIGKAYEVLRQSLQIEPTRYASHALGTIDINENRIDSAVALLGEAVSLSRSPAERAESGTTLAIAYVRNGMADRAVEQLRTILAETPRYGPALKLLAQIERQGGSK
jgi:tetratricopeptide (TPR) repeat protein